MYLSYELLILILYFGIKLTRAVNHKLKYIKNVKYVIIYHVFLLCNVIIFYIILQLSAWHHSLPNPNSSIRSKQAHELANIQEIRQKPTRKVEKFGSICMKNSKSSARRTREPLPERVSSMFFQLWNRTDQKRVGSMFIKVTFITIGIKSNN